MTWKRLINGSILGIIGVVFIYDSVVYFLSDGYSISGQINEWILQGNNVWIFGGVVLVLCFHFMFDYYERNK